MSKGTTENNANGKLGNPATPDTTKLDDLKEKLASIEHERWSDWQKWCHEVLRESMPDHWTELNNVLERWDKQIATSYKDLSEREKQSDRDQVDRYWSLILAWSESEKKRAVLEARIDEIGGVQLEHGNYTSTTYVNGEALTVKDRYNQLKTELANLKEK